MLCVFDDLLNIKDLYFIAFPKWTLENPSNKSQNKEISFAKTHNAHTHKKQNKKIKIIKKKYRKDWTETNKKTQKKVWCDFSKEKPNTQNMIHKLWFEQKINK